MNVELQSTRHIVMGDNVGHALNHVDDIEADDTDVAALELKQQGETKQELDEMKEQARNEAVMVLEDIGAGRCGGNTSYSVSSSSGVEGNQLHDDTFITAPVAGSCSYCLVCNV